MSLFYKGKREYKSTSGSVKSGTGKTTVYYTVSSDVPGTFTYTVNGSTAYVTTGNGSNESITTNPNCTGSVSKQRYVTGNTSGLEGSNTISNTFTPADCAKGNYNSKTVNYTATATAAPQVTFDPDGGSVSPTSKIVYKGSTYGTLPTPTKSNYLFLGWDGGGKNLFNMDAWLDSVRGYNACTATKTYNSIKLTATGDDCYTSDAYEDPSATIPYKIKVKPNTTYTLSWTSSNKNVQGRVHVFMNGAIDSNTVYVWQNITSSLTFTTTSNTEFVTVRVGVHNTGNTITYSNIQLEEGSSATTYEPFHRSKNLFSVQHWLSTVNDLNYCTMVKGTDSIKLTATGSDCYTLPFNHPDIPYMIRVKPSTTYTLSWASSNRNVNGLVYVFVNGIVNSSNWFRVDQKSATKLTFTTPSNAEYITLRFGIQDSGNTVTYSNIQLEEGSTATTYEPYYVTSSTTVTSTKNHTLAARWKDNKAPTIGTSPWTSIDGWSGFSLPLNAMVSGDELHIKEFQRYNSDQEISAISPKYNVDGQVWTRTLDVYSPNNSSGGAGYAPGGECGYAGAAAGFFSSSTYWSSDLNPANGDNAYSGNGNAPSFPLNTWTTSDCPWQGYGGYGANVKYVQLGYMNNYSPYSSPYYILRNHKVISSGLTNTTYNIDVTPSDNTGTAITKYIAGNKTAAECRYGGTTFTGKFQVWQNGTWTLCAIDWFGNISTTTVTVDKIGNPYIAMRNTITAGHYGYYTFDTGLQDYKWSAQGAVPANGAAPSMANSTNAFVGPPDGTYKLANEVLAPTALVAGTNNYNFSSSFSGAQQVYLQINDHGYATGGSFKIGGLKIKVDGSYYTLEQLVSMKYIEPYVLMNSSDYGLRELGYWPNFLNLYYGGETEEQIFPFGVIYFFTRPGHSFQGIQLYSSAATTRANEGYGIRLSYQSNWRMAYTGSPTNSPIAGAVRWNDNYQNHVIPMGSLPSTVYSSRITESFNVPEMTFIGTENGQHRLCMSVTGWWNGNCIPHGFSIPYSNKKDVVNVLSMYMNNSLTGSSASCRIDSNNDVYCQYGGYACTAYANGTTMCGWQGQYCAVNADGSAFCTTG